MWLMKRYFPSPHRSFYCSFTPALFCDCKKAQNKFGFTFGRCFHFEICKPCVCHREQDITTRREERRRGEAGGGGAQGWKKIQIDMPRAEVVAGGGVFFLKTLLAPRLAIVAREKNGKTIFCRFVPSSPCSFLYCFFPPFFFFSILLLHSLT